MCLGGRRAVRAWPPLASRALVGDIGGAILCIRPRLRPLLNHGDHRRDDVGRCRDGSDGKDDGRPNRDAAQHPPRGAACRAGTRSVVDRSRGDVARDRQRRAARRDVRDAPHAGVRDAGCRGPGRRYVHHVPAQGPRAPAPRAPRERLARGPVDRHTGASPGPRPRPPHLRPPGHPGARWGGFAFRRVPLRQARSTEPCPGARVRARAAAQHNATPAAATRRRASHPHPTRAERGSPN